MQGLKKPRKEYKLVKWYSGKEIEIPEEWDVFVFDKIIANKQTHRYTKIKKRNYLKKGLCPIIDQGKSFVCRYTILTSKSS